MLILASGSPRRRELLSRLTPGFEVIPSEIEELFNPEIAGVGQQVSELAERKARATAEQYPEAWVLGADTIVYLEPDILGKPKDQADAEAMLKSLSSQSHQVITGVALVRYTSAGQWLSWRDFASSCVEMRALSEAEIRAYIATGEPLDKAGAYAIQGGAAPFITRIEGSYENIVGLPLELTKELLRRGGYPL